MTVCRYFLNGNCHFGERCRFDHPRNNPPGFGDGGGGFNNNRNASGFQNNNRFAPLNNNVNSVSGQVNKNAGQPNIKDMTPREIADIIAQEMKVWDASKMWPFSCFTYSKDGQCISGFNDISPEELRMEAYEMQKNNTFHIYQQKVANLAQEYKQKRMALKTQQSDIKQKLIEEIQSHKSGVKTQTGVPNISATTGLFGNTAAPSAPQTQGLFGKPPTNLASQVPTGLFSAALNQSQPTQSPFSSSSQVFGGTAPIGGSVFGSSTPAQPPTSQNVGLLGPAPQAQPTPGLFGQHQQQQTFQSNQAPTGLFGKPGGLAPGLSNQMHNTNPVSNVAQPGVGLFGKGPAPAPAPAPATGLFGKPAAGSVFGGNPSSSVVGFSQSQPSTMSQQILDSLYTPLDKLTDEEKKQYSADTFELGCIPIQPPPREMI